MRINNYAKDTDVTATDKWIGTDSNSFNQTKNFTPTTLADYYNHNQVINSPYLTFKYQTLAPGEIREDGTISFVTEIGSSIPFSSIYTFLVSHKSLKGNNVSEYLNFLNGGKIILSRAEDINHFGFYGIKGLTPYIPNADFFVVTLDFIDGNGSMLEDKDYIVSLLVDKYGPSGGNETLAETLLLGNNTGGTDILLNSSDSIVLENSSLLKKGTYDFGQSGGISRICGVGFEDMWQGGIRHVFDSNGFIRNSTNCFDIVPDVSFDNTLRFKIGSIWTLDDGTNYICTDATIGSAVWELYNVIPSSSSFVPYTGATSDIELGPQNIIAQYLDFYTGFNFENFFTINNSTLQGVYISPDGISLSTNGLGINGVIRSDLLTTTHKYYELPDASGTLALTSDITGLVPYTGAINTININTQTIIAEYFLEGLANQTYFDFGGFSTSDELAQTAATLSANGILALSSNGLSNNGVIKSDLLTDHKEYQLPDDSGTFALTSNIPTKTSDLINDGDNGISHFISLEDLPSNIVFYPTNVASDISGYVKIVTSITDPSYNTTAVDISTGAITTTNQLISSLATSANIIVGNPGVFNITTIGNIRRISGSGQASFYFKVYKRTIAGVETLIATSDNTIPVIDGGVYTEFTATAIWNDGIFLDTDRVVMKYYANRISGGSNPTYQFQFGGVIPVRTLVPIPLTVVGGGIVYKLKSTYASMIADGTPSTTTMYSVTTDENKSLSRCLYIWRTDGKREYIPSTPDN